MFDLKSLFFPDYCLNCQNGDQIVCQNCLRDTLNLACYLRKRNVSSALLPYFFGKESFWVAKALHHLKYEGFTRLAEDLNRLLIPFLPDLPIVVVPISLKKRKKRGFNQLEIILKSAGKIQMANILIKKSDNQAQMSLKAEDRKKNVEGQFKVILGANVAEKLVIFDDMQTTGSTLDEIANVLKAAGAREIQRITLLGKIDLSFTELLKNDRVGGIFDHTYENWHRRIKIQN